MSTRKNYRAEQKVKIVREHLVNCVPVSTLAERYGIHPNLIHKWQKQMFEGALETFQGKRGAHTQNGATQERRQRKIEGRLQQRESLISELLLENIRLKKNLDGED